MKSKKLRVDETSKIICERVLNFGMASKYQNTGSVLTVGDGIARIYGLETAMLGELVEFDSGIQGVILNLELNYPHLKVWG